MTPDDYPIRIDYTAADGTLLLRYVMGDGAPEPRPYPTVLGDGLDWRGPWKATFYSRNGRVVMEREGTDHWLPIRQRLAGEEWSYYNLDDDPNWKGTP